MSKNKCTPLLFNYDIYSAMSSKLIRNPQCLQCSCTLTDPLKRCSGLNKVIKEDPKTMCLISSSQEMTMFGHREDIAIAVTWI